MAETGWEADIRKNRHQTTGVNAMRCMPVTSLTGIFLIVQPFSPSASGASAQEPSDSGVAGCTVQVAARTLDAGLSAVQVWAYFDRDIGRVQNLHASEESGITLASPDLLNRIRGGGDGRPESPDSTGDRDSVPDRIRPIAMGPEPRSARLWLDLFDARAGEHEITLEGDAGRCRGRIKVDG